MPMPTSPVRRSRRALRWSALGAAVAAVAASAVVAASPQATALGRPFNITVPGLAQPGQPASCLTVGDRGTLTLRRCASGQAQGFLWYQGRTNTRLASGGVCFTVGRSMPHNGASIYPVAMQPCAENNRAQKVSFLPSGALILDALPQYCSTVYAGGQVWLAPCRSDWASRQRLAFRPT